MVLRVRVGITAPDTLNFSRPASASEAVFLMLLLGFALILLFLGAETSWNCLLVQIYEERDQLFFISSVRMYMKS